MLDLTGQELQKLVLMVGSKKALGIYLGLDAKATSSLWTENNLLTPLDWLRTQTRHEQLELLARHGSLKKLADHLSCSESALRPIYMGPPIRELDWELDFVTAQFERYRSVRLVAYMNGVGESLVRREVERHELELTDLIDYSFGDNSNSKGRRAELEYVRLRGEFVTLDANKTNGSQADYDFMDTELGRVNVKSSRQWKFKAQTRKANPLFWKVSTSGFETCDHFVCLCYDQKMQTLLGVYIIRAEKAKHTKTLTITTQELLTPNVLSASYIP